MTLQDDSMTEYTLWGFHPLYVGKDGKPYLIQLEIGSLRECKSEQKHHEMLGGWTLGTYAKATDVTGSALNIQLDNYLKTVSEA